MNVMQSIVLDRPVIDRTGISGRWDFVLTWTPDETQYPRRGRPIPPPGDDPAAPPGLFTAIVQQIGLRLKPANVPVDVLVIDRVEKPSAN